MSLEKLKVKICGMREKANIEQITLFAPDYLGFIFYKDSKRYVGEYFPLENLALIPSAIQKVGVFVNVSIDYIFSQVAHYQLDNIQLHGNESPDFCEALKSPILRGARGISPIVKTIKAFSVDNTFDFTILENYKFSCDYFLFDTKGKDYGGNGEKFDWQILQQYAYTTPFFVSGGIALENIEELFNFVEQNPQLPIEAIDVNSRFEQEPAVKNLEKVQKLFQALNTRKV